MAGTILALNKGGSPPVTQGWRQPTAVSRNHITQVVLVSLGVNSGCIPALLGSHAQHSQVGGMESGKGCAYGVIKVGWMCVRWLCQRAGK